MHLYNDLCNCEGKCLKDLILCWVLEWFLKVWEEMINRINLCVCFMLLG